MLLYTLHKIQRTMYIIMAIKEYKNNSIECKDKELSMSKIMTIK